MRKLFRMILHVLAVLGSILQADGAVRMVDRYLVLTQKCDSIKHIFHVSPELKINFEGDDFVIESDSIITRIPHKEITDYFHVCRSSLTLNLMADNEDGTPLPDVFVKLLSSASTTEKMQQTDLEGTSCFNEIAPGYYEIEITDLPLFADYRSESPFLQIEDSDIQIILKEIVRNPEITSFEIIETDSDMFDIKFSLSIDSERPEETYGYTFFVTLDGISFTPIDTTAFELQRIGPGEHFLTVQGISPYGSESKLCQHRFNLEAESSGVWNIKDSSDETSELYDLNGISVKKPNMSQGIYIKPGEKKTEKVIIR